MQQQLSFIVSTQDAREELFNAMSQLIQSHNLDWEMYKLYLRKNVIKLHTFATNMCLEKVYESASRNRNQQKGIESVTHGPVSLVGAHLKNVVEMNKEFEQFYFDAVVHT